MIVRVTVAVGVSLLLLTGCGGGGSKATASPTVTPSASPTTASQTASPTTAASAKPGTQAAKVTPATGLKDGQTVTVSGAGFTPREPLVITQCVDKGKATTSGDCNLASLVSVTSLADGSVAAFVTVAKGPFGANKVVCGAPYRCLISITQASPTPKEEADAPISFG